MDVRNKISIFAENAIESVTQQSSDSIGYFYPDNTWKGTYSGDQLEPFPERYKGAYEGIAYSINYNTALRQATFMSTVLAEIMVKRNAESNVYPYMSANGIGTMFDSSEGSLDNHATNIADIFSKANFLMAGEVTTAKINDKAVTTSKVNDYAITYQKLGNVLGTKTSTSNGMTVTLSQTSDRGQINISISGSNVTNSDKAKVQTSNSKIYLDGTLGTSGYQDHYANSNVYMQSGTIYSTNNVATGYMQAQSFYATSDARKKYDVYSIDHNTVKEIIENTEIRHFKYKDSNRDCVGIIAQDVEHFNLDNFKLAEKGQDGYLMVSESKIVYILWDYIKQLEKRVRELENKN